MQRIQPLISKALLPHANCLRFYSKLHRPWSQNGVPRPQSLRHQLASQLYRLSDSRFFQGSRRLRSDSSLHHPDGIDGVPYEMEPGAPSAEAASRNLKSDKMRAQAELLSHLMRALRQAFGTENADRVARDSLGGWPLHLAEEIAGTEISLQRKISRIESAEVQVELVVPMIKAFQKEFGTRRARDVIRKGIDTYTTAYGKFIAAHNNGSSVQKMATAYSTFADGGETIQYTVEKDTPQAYDPIVNRCRYAELFKKIGEPELGAILFCEADYPMVRAIGPDLELFRTETMMMGAKRCDFRYRLKETAKDNRT